MNHTTTNHAKGTTAAQKPAATTSTTTTATTFPFTRFQPLNGGESVDLSPSKNDGGGALVLRTSGTDWDEVVCVWTDGVTFAPSDGSYFVFWFKQLPGFIKPSENDLRGFLIAKGQAGPPGTINLRPPPTPIDE